MAGQKSVCKHLGFVLFSMIPHLLFESRFVWGPCYLKLWKKVYYIVAFTAKANLLNGCLSWTHGIHQYWSCWGCLCELSIEGFIRSNLAYYSVNVIECKKSEFYSQTENWGTTPLGWNWKRGNRVTFTLPRVKITLKKSKKRENNWNFTPLEWSLNSLHERVNFHSFESIHSKKCGVITAVVVKCSDHSPVL